MMLMILFIVGMGLVQWGLPHLSYLVLRRRLPQLGILRTVPLVLLVALLLWYVLSQLVFERTAGTLPDSHRNPAPARGRRASGILPQTEPPHACPPSCPTTLHAPKPTP